MTKLYNKFEGIVPIMSMPHQIEISETDFSPMLSLWDRVAGPINTPKG